MSDITWKKESQRDYFGKALLELGREEPRLVVVGADTTESLKTAMFGKEFPDRLFNIGIAEQNMIGIAAGLAACGKLAFAATYAVFGTAQVYHVIRQSIAYPKLNVKIFCSHAGPSVGPDGATHQMSEDISLMRSLPNMTVLVPCDAPETGRATRAAAQHVGPVYCRFSRASVPTVTSLDDEFKIGKATVMRDGSDVSLIGCGVMVSKCLEAANELDRKGVNARVLNMSTIKPIDTDAINKAAEQTGAIVTTEEHSVINGLGTAVAQEVVRSRPVPMRMVGMPDRFGVSGESEEVLEIFGLTSAKVVEAAEQVAKKRGG